MRGGANFGNFKGTNYASSEHLHMFRRRYHIRHLKLKRNPSSSIGKHRYNPLFSLRRTGVGRVVTSASSYDFFGSGKNESYGSAAKQIPELKDRFHVHTLVMYVCWFPYPVNCVSISTSIATSVRNIDTMSRPTGARSACNIFPI